MNVKYFDHDDRKKSPAKGGPLGTQCPGSVSRFFDDPRTEDKNEKQMAAEICRMGDWSIGLFHVADDTWYWLQQFAAGEQIVVRLSTHGLTPQMAVKNQAIILSVIAPIERLTGKLQLEHFLEQLQDANVRNVLRGGDVPNELSTWCAPRNAEVGAALWILGIAALAARAATDSAKGKDVSSAEELLHSYGLDRDREGPSMLRTLRERNGLPIALGWSVPASAVKSIPEQLGGFSEEDAEKIEELASALSVGSINEVTNATMMAAIRGVGNALGILSLGEAAPTPKPR